MVRMMRIMRIGMIRMMRMMRMFSWNDGIFWNTVRLGWVGFSS